MLFTTIFYPSSIPKLAQNYHYRFFFLRDKNNLIFFSGVNKIVFFSAYNLVIVFANILYGEMLERDTLIIFTTLFCKPFYTQIICVPSGFNFLSAVFREAEVSGGRQMAQKILVLPSPPLFCDFLSTDIKIKQKLLIQ